MDSDVSTYNILVYEPESTQPGLKIARAVLDKVVLRSDEMTGEKRFIVNTAPYEELGHIPGVLGEFADVYDKLAPGGIAVTFLNTAYESPANDFERLAELFDRFPAMCESAWVVTTSLRQPMPKSFKSKVNELRNGAPGGKGGKHLTVTEGLPSLVPIGDSIVITAMDEAASIVFERLQYLRKWEGND